MRGASTLRLARFRQNEVLRAITEEHPGPFAFRCECEDTGCGELVLVEAAGVHDVRANPRRLVLAVGHETPHERTVLAYDGYLIVEVG